MCIGTAARRLSTAVRGETAMEYTQDRLRGYRRKQAIRDRSEANERVSHSHTTRTDHPVAVRAATFFLSRWTFARNLASQNAALEIGLVPRAQLC